MALLRVCDRCGAAAVGGDLATTTRTIVIPRAEPATLATLGDTEISLGVEVRGSDLCAICQTSALVEYALQQLAQALTPERLLSWSTRINGVIGGRG